ncbi:RNA-directed DNA polymerase, eukaryota, reverse transcriptase zinc-binding domain protein [Tanacetum coccineum]
MNELICSTQYFEANKDGVDKWFWSKDVPGTFKVKSLLSSLQDRLFTGDNLGLHHVCNSWIPRKVNICVWRASIERLATKPRLIARGVNMESDLCAFCEVSSESTSRCLLVCPHVKTIWRKIRGWWNFANPVSFPSFDVLDISINKIADLGYSRLNKVIHGVFLGHLEMEE